MGIKVLNFIKKSVVAAVLSSATLIGPTASAESILAFATRVGNATGTTTHIPVPLDNSGHTSLAFNTAAPNRLIKITYNAKCGALGNFGNYLSVTILVDGVQANPQSGNSFALCIAATTTQYVLLGAVRQSLIAVPSAGTHSVRVIVDRQGITSWLLGDTSLVVEGQ
jgi:hypothetical protein